MRRHPAVPDEQGIPDRLDRMAAGTQLAVIGKALLHPYR
jgi:hypothetical protein